ncbi:MAG: SDR family NAD(P)-dependent oxidoreductase [Cyanobacteria bacterium J06627_28]
MPLTNKVALVTSSRQGICLDMAKRLAKAGAKVMICGRDGFQGRATADQIQAEGGRASFILTDTAVPVDVQAAIDETIATYGRLDILLNSVSSDYPHDGALENVSETAWDRITETSLKGTFLCCQYALPFLQKTGSGTIINLVDQADSPPSNAVASICQGGVLAMTSAIAQHSPTQNVTANLVWSPHPPEQIFGLLTEKVICSPSDMELSNREPSDAQAVAGAPAASPEADVFTDVAAAVMHLAIHGYQLNGYALIVSPLDNSG